MLNDRKSKDKTRISLKRKGNKKGPLYRNYPAKRLLPFMQSEIENNILHLFKHKIVREMGINSADKPFGRITHPDIYDVGTNILLADGSEGMTEIILSDIIIVHDAFENTVENVCSM